MASMIVALHSKRLLSPEWVPDGHDGDPLKIHITRLSAYEDQAGNLKSVVLRLFCVDRVSWLSVGGTGKLTALVAKLANGSETLVYPYGRMRVSANFISNAGANQVIEWTVAFKPAKE